MSKVIIYIIFLLGLIIGYTKYIEIKGVYFPTKEIEFSPEFIYLAFEDVYIETKDGFKINGWFIPHDNAKYTVLLLHGNGGNICHRLDKIGFLRSAGVNIFIIDYRGYGRSQGRPSERGIYIDARAAYDYLLTNRSIKPDEIILYGESLGTAVAINLASEIKVKALILEGAFSRGRDMAKKLYPFLPSFLFSDQFDSLAKIKKINTPKLFMHSIDDEIVPIDLAKKLYNASSGPKQFVELKGGHNNAFLDSKETYILSITSFVVRL